MEASLHKYREERVWYEEVKTTLDSFSSLALDKLVHPNAQDSLVLVHPKKDFFERLTVSVNFGWADIQRRVNEYRGDAGLSSYHTESDESSHAGAGAPSFYNPMTLSKEECYRIVHHFVVFSMFDNGFQNKSILIQAKASSFCGTFINFCPCNKRFGSFIERHDIQHLIKKQLDYQCGDNKKKNKSVFCGTEQMPNDKLFQHIYSKQQNCFIHILFYHFLQKIYPEINCDYTIQTIGNLLVDSEESSFSIQCFIYLYNSINTKIVIQHYFVSITSFEFRGNPYDT